MRGEHEIFCTRTFYASSHKNSIDDEGRLMYLRDLSFTSGKRPPSIEACTYWVCLDLHVISHSLANHTHIRVISS